MNEIPFDVTVIRIVSAICMLSLASIFDMWKREVHDILWIAFAFEAGLLIFLEPNTYEFLLTLGISLIIAPIANLFWRIGFFGGADAFCIIVLSSLAPLLTITHTMISPLTTLTNAAVLSAILPLLNAGYNGFLLIRHKNIFDGFDESRKKKIIAMFLGRRVKNPKFGFSIERKIKNFKKFDFTLHHAENFEFCNMPDTWITQAMPYILYITGGFIIQIFYGDILLKFLIG